MSSKRRSHDSIPLWRHATHTLLNYHSLCNTSNNILAQNVNWGSLCCKERKQWSHIRHLWRVSQILGVLMPFCHRALTDVSIAPVTMETNVSPPTPCSLASLNLSVSPIPKTQKQRCCTFIIYLFIFYCCVCVPHTNVFPLFLRSREEVMGFENI